MKRFRCGIIVAGLLALLPSVNAADKIELRDGDRVVFLGNTLIEREQRSGYWELALTIANPDKNITFRNLGWSGDTVWGEARGRFGGTSEGFRHLKDHVLALKPTVIVLGYGGNESFAGEAGVPNFQKGLDTLLDTLAPTKARIVILSPLRQEKMPPPLPDPAEQNKNIKLYRDVLQKTAEKRGHAFVDLFELGGQQKLTDNGIHLSPYGYWATGLEIAKALGAGPGDLELDVKQAKDLAWKTDGKRLPMPMANDWRSVNGAPVVRVPGLAPGKYTLLVDGKKAHTAENWSGGVVRNFGPDVDQAEKLRAAIIDKNQLYFHRWRPQNETYLFLFRKNEQGQNAKEIPQFDPLIEKLEAEIARLRVPAVREYKLVAEKGGE